LFGLSCPHKTIGNKKIDRYAFWKYNISLPDPFLASADGSDSLHPAQYRLTSNPCPVELQAIDFSHRSAQPLDGLRLD
jgi:hypothetical protein